MSELYCKWPNPYAKSNAKACAFWDVKDDMDIPLWKSASSIMNCGCCRHHVWEQGCSIMDVLKEYWKKMEVF